MFLYSDNPSLFLSINVFQVSPEEMTEELESNLTKMVVGNSSAMKSFLQVGDVDSAMSLASAVLSVINRPTSQVKNTDNNILVSRFIGCTCFDASAILS